MTLETLTSGKIAVISDIHANEEAFRVVLEHIEKNNIKTILNCGDIVGYGPSPKECIELAKQYIAASAVGNHDYGALSQDNRDYITSISGEHAAPSFFWTFFQLTNEDREYLANQPLTIACNGIVISHGSVVQNKSERPSFEYLRGSKHIRKNLKYLEQQEKKMLFYGHSHKFGIEPPGKILSVIEGKIQEKDIELPSEPCLINVGSVGQPRDYDNRACYVQLNGSQLKVIRLPYDFQKTQRKIRKTKTLPESLAERLGYGH